MLVESGADTITLYLVVLQPDGRILQVCLGETGANGAAETHNGLMQGIGKTVEVHPFEVSLPPVAELVVR